MAGSSQPGPVCGHNNPASVKDGTLCLTETPVPRSVSADLEDYFSSAGARFSSEYANIKSEIGSSYREAEQRIESNYEGARCLYQASQQAEDLVPEAVLTETGYEVSTFIKGLVPGLIQMIVIMAATTVLGAAVGGIVGFFCGGVGAAPGAVVGGELGMDAGVAILTWLGVAFLAVSIAKGIGEMMGALRNGVEQAWAARNLHGPAQERQIGQAAKEIARSVGILMRLILQAIVAYLLKRAAVGATRSAVGTVRAVKSEGAGAVSEATVAELVGKLRASRFGRGLADWVDKNWQKLVKDPKLRVPLAESAVASGAAGMDSATSESTTPPAPKPKSEAPAEPKPAGVTDLKSATSGATIDATPGKTTTVLGRYQPDMKSVLKQLDAPKSADFGPKPGGFNVLNVDAPPDMPAEEFWNTYNKPFLDQAIARGDNIALATDPTPSQLTNDLGEPTMFGREVKYLQENGYTYDPATRTMVKQ